MENCIFCKIAKGEIKPKVIFENDLYISFLDANPIAPGHTLVIPKKHTSYIFDLKDEEYSDLMLVSKNIAKILKEKLSPRRVAVLVEGFGVDHVHVHLVPINVGGQVCLQYAKHATEKELNEITDKILK